MHLQTRQPSRWRRVLIASLAMTVSTTACSVATEDVASSEIERVAATSEPTPNDVAQAEPEPTPTVEPDPVGVCGPAATPAPGQISWDVTTEPVPGDVIQELSESGPSTSFYVNDPVVATDSAGKRFVLGPAWPIEVEVIEPIEAFDARSCTLELTMTTAGLATFNEVANLCFRTAPRCVTGQLAIVVDGEVVFAPTVQSPSFTEPSVVISSPNGYGPDDAPLIAQRIADGAQFRPVLLELPI